MEINKFYMVRNEIMRWSASMPLPIETEIDIPDLDSISNRICDLFKVKEKDVFERTKKKEMVFIRQIMHSIAMAFKLKYGANWSAGEIGGKMGDKDHATVLHSARTISDMIDTGYEMVRINRAIEEFDLYVSDLHYIPTKKIHYKNLVFKENGMEVNRFLNATDAATYHEVHVSTIIQPMIYGRKFRKRYTIEFEQEKIN